MLTNNYNTHILAYQVLVLLREAQINVSLHTALMGIAHSTDGYVQFFQDWPGKLTQVQLIH